MECPWCGSDAVEVTTLDQSRRAFLCWQGHSFLEPVIFRVADSTGYPTHVLMVAGPPVPWDPDAGPLMAHAWDETIIRKTAYCGPPAPFPKPPTPAEILEAAGLGYLFPGQA
jgi:hypothetical protein